MSTEADDSDVQAPQKPVAEGRVAGVAVVAGVGLSLALWRIGAAPWLAIVVAFSVMLAALGDTVVRESLHRGGSVWGLLTRRDQKRLKIAVAERLDKPTHDPFRAAAAKLDALADRTPTLDLAPDERAVVLRARDLVRWTAAAIRETRPERDATRRRRGERAVLELDQLADDDPDVGALVIRYANPASLPGWVPSRAVRPLTRIGAILHDVRPLHTAQIEAAVLLFTLWARLVIVAFAPLLNAVALGPVPLQHGVTPRDLPFLAAVVCCAVTALVAPWLMRQVMRDDAAGARVRARLIAVEVPVAVAALLAWPCWPVAVFAAGWTNWWQRPVFNWVKLALWIVAVAACLAAGAALDGDLRPDTATAIAIAFVVVFVIGDSYGAMLPVSATVLLRTAIGRLLFPRRAQRAADEQLSRAVADLREAARITERHATSDAARDDAQRLREIADELAATSERDDRWLVGTPLDLQTLLDVGLTRRAPRSGSPAAALALDQALERGEPAPLTVDEPVFEDEVSQRLRFGVKRHAEVLAEMLDVLAREAHTHGSGPMMVVCGVADGAVVIKLANARRDPPAPAGTGRGSSELRELREQLPGATLAVRGMVPGTFVDLLPTQERFGVELRVPLNLFIAADTR